MSRKVLKDPTPLKEVLGQALKGMGMEMGPEGLLIRLSWEEVVGEQIARHAKPGGLQRGRLFVMVEDSIWLYHLSLLKSQIVASINERLKAPVVKEVYLKLGKLLHRRVKKPLPPQPLLEEQELAVLLASVQGLSCAEVLRRLLQRAAGR